MPGPWAKRIFDVCVACLLLVVLSPLFVFAVAALALDMLLVPADRGPWLYRERRVSAGREFDVLKFRVLRVTAIASIGRESYARLLESDHDNLTRAGRAIKAVYADELPQLLNVLRGEMSLVGPRPWPLAMVERQRADGYDYRDRVLAGWTGPAQVQKDLPGGKRGATERDLAYVEALETWPALRLLRFDVETLWESVRTMARGKGLRY